MTIISDAEKRRLLKVRAQLKAKRPKFRAQESWRYKRIDPKWRRPRGIDSKMRKKVKGWPRLVDVGFRGPRKVRYLHPLGKEEVLISSVEELERLDPQYQVARIRRTLGRKKREEIIELATLIGIHVVNPNLPERRITAAPTELEMQEALREVEEEAVTPTVSDEEVEEEFEESFGEEEE